MTKIKVTSKTLNHLHYGMPKCLTAQTKMATFRGTVSVVSNTKPSLVSNNGTGEINFNTRSITSLKKVRNDKI